MKIINVHSIMGPFCSVSTNLMCFDLWFLVKYNPSSTLHILQCNYCGHTLRYRCSDILCIPRVNSTLGLSLFEPALGYNVPAFFTVQNNITNVNHLTHLKKLNIIEKKNLKSVSNLLRNVYFIDWKSLGSEWQAS